MLVVLNKEKHFMSLPVTLDALDRYLVVGTFTLRALDRITLPTISPSTRNVIKFGRVVNVPDLQGAFLLFRQAIESRAIDDHGIASRDRVVKLGGGAVQAFRDELRQFAETFAGDAYWRVITAVHQEKNEAVREKALSECENAKGFLN